MAIFDARDIFQGGSPFAGMAKRIKGRFGMRRAKKRIIAIIAVLIVLCIACFMSASFIVDVLWSSSMCFEQVLWTSVAYQGALFAVGFIATFAVLLFNWRAALSRGLAASIADGWEEPSRPLMPRAVVFIGAAAVALFGGMWLFDKWETAALFLHSVDHGRADPIFGLDISFYIFKKPAIDIVRAWASGVLLLSLAGSAACYMLCRGDGSEPSPALSRAARSHVMCLASLFVLTIAIGFWFDRYELLYSPDGIVFGMGYTDMNIKLPALTVISIAAAAIALLLFVNVFRPMIRVTVGAAILTAALGAAALIFAPGVVQSFVVQPNEYELEKEFIAMHIAATREAYSIDDVRTEQIVPGGAVSAAEMRENADAVANIRLWDYGPLLRTYKQLQEIRTYYDFGDVDIDRYDIGAPGGARRQVMLAVRELDLGSLQNRTWVNSHLEFTHGCGVVMNPVNEIEPGGLPVFFMKDLPTSTSVQIKVDRPEIYYGEAEDVYALVRTKVREFDYPIGDSNARSVYEGNGGVSIGSFLRRLLFAVYFSDSEILFTDALTDESRILFNRNIKRAVRLAAPFLIYDGDAYPVLIDGRIFWVQDAYTWSTLYPYSLPLSAAAASYSDLWAYKDINYLRNSVKVAIDAYDGSMAFYITDEDDPVIKSWRGVFPDLFRGPEEIPDELREHFRYPEELFEVQSEMFRTYHMTDTNTFYNREDVWMTGAAGQGGRFRPNYVTMKLLGESAPEFTMIIPFLPAGRNNLIGWMAARCDGDAYGELIAYQFPKQELVYGPPQIEALIDQNTEISSQLSLWSQHGSEVIRGDLLVIPIGSSLLYVEPLYLRAERGGLPELKRVILSTGGRLAWGEDFEDAALKLFGGAEPAVEQAEQTERPQPVAPTSSAIGAASRARQHFDAAQRAAGRGDWTAYGEELKELERALIELERAEKGDAEQSGGEI